MVYPRFILSVGEKSLQFWNVVVTVAGSNIDAHRRAERIFSSMSDDL